MNQDNKMIMQCDTETGICELPLDVPTRLQENKGAADKNIKPLRLLYFTDPICSSCWGIEPQLRKLKLEYGHYFDIEYRMGGLLKNWSSYGGKDVSGPESVAKHWDEAGDFYGMPIDGDIWKQDPLDSSYPPSIAFKAAQMQDPMKAEKFLRRIREMVFMEKKNITLWENLATAALECGLEVVQFKKDFYGDAINLFKQDLQLRSEWGVRGFPTIFFIDANGKQQKVYGSRSYEEYEKALLDFMPSAKKNPLPASNETLLEQFGTLTAKELSVLQNRKPAEAEIILDYLVQQNLAIKIPSRNGSLWKRSV